METVELRPLSLGELLDRTFTLYRRHFWVFVGIMAVPSSFAIPFNVFFLAKQGSMMTPTAPPFGVPRTGPVGPPAAQLAAIGAVFLAALVFLVVFWMAYSLAMGAAAYAISQSYLGQTTTVRESYRKVGEKFWRLLGVTLNILLRMIGIVAGIFAVVAGVVGAAAVGMAALGAGTGSRIALTVVIALLIVAAYIGAMVLTVYMALRYAVSIPALMLENRGVLDAIRRSIQLTKGRRGQIFVAFLLAALIGYVGAIVFQGPFLVPMMISLMRNVAPPAWLMFVMGISGAVGGSITGPISMIVLVLCYYDARIRKEAFDLQFMMSTLEKPVVAPGPVLPA